LFLNTKLNVKIDMMRTIKNNNITFKEFENKYKNKVA
jgi:hypothetical protein